MGDAGTPLATSLHRCTRMRSLVSSSTSKREEEDEEEDDEEEEAPPPPLSPPPSPPSPLFDQSLSATAAARGHATESRLLPSTISPHTQASPPMTSEATPCGGPQETGGEAARSSSSSPPSSERRSKLLLFRETATAAAAVAFPLSPRPPLQLLPPFIPSVGSTAYLFNSFFYKGGRIKVSKGSERSEFLFALKFFFSCFFFSFFPRFSLPQNWGKKQNAHLLPVRVSSPAEVQVPRRGQDRAVARRGGRRQGAAPRPLCRGRGRVVAGGPSAALPPLGE